VVAPVVTLAPPEGNPILAETLERQLNAVGGLIEKAVGAPVQVQFASKSPEAAAPRPRRLSEGQARAERLRGLLTKDPALEAAAEGLDLEALD
jgi:hypothetical protein